MCEIPGEDIYMYKHYACFQMYVTKWLIKYILNQVPDMHSEKAPACTSRQFGQSFLGTVLIAKC